jgi:YfiH family protein
MSNIQIIPAFPQFPEVMAFFTTRQGGCSSGPFCSLNLGLSTEDSQSNVTKNWQKLSVKYEFDIKNLKMPGQMHSDVIKSSSEFTNLASRPKGDAVHTQKEGEVLAVTLADCLGILIYDRALRTIAAVHAGWKGTSLGVLEKTLTWLKTSNLINPRTVCLSFSPCIQPENYEVGADVAKLFNKKCLYSRGKKVMLSLPQANKFQALSCGVPAKNLIISSDCTYSQPERYFSYRRDGKLTGRSAAVISLHGERK